MRRLVKRGAGKGLAAALAAMMSAPAPAQNYAGPPLSPFAARLLAAHNFERAQLRLPPLAWNPALIPGAAAHAQYLASTGAFHHSNRKARRGVGENLWMGTRGAFSPEQMVGNWASEKRWFARGIFPNVSRSGGWSAVAHYTQIIWPATTQLGCAVAIGRGREVLVCHYAPAGNIDGRPVG